MKRVLPDEKKIVEGFESGEIFGYAVGAGILLIIRILFLVIGVILLKWSYNNSLPLLNTSYKEMNWGTAFIFAIFLWTAGAYWN
jgi:hypothetical protein